MDVVNSEELNEKILKQIEYYFSDINLVRDKFMIAEMETDEGWFTLDCLMKFSRLKHLCNGNAEVMRLALQKCCSDLIEFDPCGKVRRKPHLKVPTNSKEFWDKVVERTAALKHLPDDVTMEELRSYCGPYGVVESVHLRRSPPPQRKFLNSAYVVFQAVEQLERFLNATKPAFRNETLISCMSEAEFLSDMKMKRKCKKEKEIDDGTTTIVNKNDAPKEKNKTKLSNKKRVVPPPLTKRRKVETVRRKGVVLRLEEMTVPIGKRQLRAVFDHLAPVDWIGHSRDALDATVRFLGPENCAVDVLEKLNEKRNADSLIEFGPFKARARLLTDDEDEAYWSRVPNLAAGDSENSATPPSTEQEVNVGVNE